jgi:plastocyanin
MSWRPRIHIASSSFRIAVRLLVMALTCAPGAAAAGDLVVRVLDKQGKPLHDAVVTARVQAGRAVQPAAPSDEVIDQVDQEFVPRVKPVLAGTRVRFPNSDSVRHQVYSFSPAKRFELPLYSGRGTAAPAVVFDTPGVVALGCNIHDWMVAYIYVSDTPHFAKTGKDGTAVLKELPPGDYNVRVWQPNLAEPEESTVRRVAIDRNGASDLEWRVEVKPAFRVRRAPVPGGGGYR